MRRRMKDDELKRFVSKLNQKREGLFFSLINVELKRRDAQKQLERRMRKRPLPVVAAEEPVQRSVESDAELNDMLDIPTYLQRPAPVVKANPGESCDAIVSGMVQGQTFEQAEILQELAQAKKVKAEKAVQRWKVREQLRHADLTGATRKMPLQGKAALAAIRRG